MLTSHPVTPELCAALAVAQGAFEPVRKDRTNPFFSAKYATLDAVIAAVRPALAANGLSVCQDVSLTNDTGIDVLTVVTRLSHASGQWMEVELSCVPRELPRKKRGQNEEDAPPPASGLPLSVQAIGAATTYLRRYSLGALLCIAPDEDDDGEANTSAPTPTPAPRPASPKPAPAPSMPGHSPAYTWMLAEIDKAEKAGGAAGREALLKLHRGRKVHPFSDSDRPLLGKAFTASARALGWATPEAFTAESEGPEAPIGVGPELAEVVRAGAAGPLALAQLYRDREAAWAKIPGDADRAKVVELFEKSCTFHGLTLADIAMMDVRS